MKKYLKNLFIIFLHIFSSWTIVISILSQIDHKNRVVFILVHHLLIIILVGLIFSIYYKFFSKFNVLITTIIAMSMFFIIEFIFYGLIYSGEFWFLNFWDLTLPTILLAITIYSSGKIFKK